MSDRSDIRLAQSITTRNRNEITGVGALLNVMLPSRCDSGPLRRRTTQLRADTDIYFAVARGQMHLRGIFRVITVSRAYPGARLRRHNWGVERAFAQLKQRHGLAVRSQ